MQEHVTDVARRVIFHVIVLKAVVKAKCNATNARDTAIVQTSVTHNLFVQSFSSRIYRTELSAFHFVVSWFWSVVMRLQWAVSYRYSARSPLRQWTKLLTRQFDVEWLMKTFTGDH